MDELVMLALAFSCILFAAAPMLPANTTDGSWQPLYTVTRPDQWLTAVWAGKDGAWFAGGKNVLVVGKDASAKVTEMPQTVVYKFGEDAATRVIAVGSGARVWAQEGDDFRLVHESPVAPRSGRAGYGDILYGIGYLDPSSAGTLMAYGPNDLIAYRLPSGVWETKRDSALASFAQIGSRDIHLPAKCRRLSWRWLARDQGFLACQNGDSYLMSGGLAQPTGRLPSACRTDMYATTRGEGQIYVSCGAGQALWVGTLASRSWERVAGAPGGIRGVVSKDGCLMAVTERKVWRRCLASPR